MVQILHSADPMATVAPPPELMLSSLTWKISNISKASPLNYLLRALMYWVSMVFSLLSFGNEI
jgi:hypothetical protein